MSDFLTAFSDDYFEARTKFLAAAKDAGARIKSIEHPKKAPNGDPIHMDVAEIGPEDAEIGLLIVSGVHGPEAYCGSGIQINMLRSPDIMAKYEGLKLVFVHGHNPYGWAWCRRVDENNIDVNRNYVDFGKPYSVNEDYELVQHLFMPDDFDDAAEQAIYDWIAEHGQKKFATAAMLGQRIDENGLFYGGVKPIWTNQTFRHEVLPLLHAQKKVMLIDLHTGLGDYADGIILHVYPKESERAQMFNRWYEGKVDGGMDVLDNDKVDYDNSGSTVASFETFYPDKDAYAMVVEYGTGDLSKILMALVKDNWLHVKGDLDSPKGKAIKKELLHMLYPNTDEWKTGVWRHASWALTKTAEGLRTL